MHPGMKIIAAVEDIFSVVSEQLIVMLLFEFLSVTDKLFERWYISGDDVDLLWLPQTFRSFSVDEFFNIS